MPPEQLGRGPLPGPTLGTSGFLRRPVRKEELRAAITIAPVSAVPTEMPRLVTVFWSPPTSPLCVLGTEETVTLPSCEASAPFRRPSKAATAQ